mgnify:CR=1 FL=1
MSKIALVDDDRNILTSVAMTLEAEGFEVETYHDGQQALDAFNKSLPDMAVLDIALATGFSSAASFSRAFRADYGQSARTLRKSLQSRIHQ